MYDNSIETDAWTYKSFNILNQNVHEQHKSMRDQLQSRHEHMVNDINQITVDTANDLGCQLIIALDGECEPSRRRLEAGGKPRVELAVKWPEISDGPGILGNLSRVRTAVKRVMEKLDIDINSDTDQSKSGKKGKQNKQRRLIESEGEDALEGQLAEMKGSITSIEGKVSAMEDKMDAIVGMLSLLVDRKNKEGGAHVVEVEE